MTTSEQTAGYLCCHFRRYGCDWAAIFRTFADEPEAVRRREVHESVCERRPDVGPLSAPSDRRTGHEPTLPMSQVPLKRRPA